jgi:flagellar biosynthesis protein FliR
VLSVTTAQLYAWLAAFMWPLARVLALVGTAPIMGSPSLPARVKIGLAIAITLVLAPALGPMPEVPPFSGAGMLILGQQIVIGLAMGLVMRIVFVSVDMAGEIAGLQMGLGFATFYDPQARTSSPVLAQFMGLLATLIFLSLNGHLLVISTLAESFAALPISADAPSALGWRTLAEWGSAIFLAGLLMSLPILAALLVTNISIGILTRAAPQLNMFAVGFPITLGIGLIVLALVLPYLAPGVERLIHTGLGTMLQIAMQVRGN